MTDQLCARHIVGGLVGGWGIFTLQPHSRLTEGQHSTLRKSQDRISLSGLQRFGNALLGGARRCLEADCVRSVRQCVLALHCPVAGQSGQSGSRAVPGSRCRLQAASDGCRCVLIHIDNKKMQNN